MTVLGHSAPLHLRLFIEGVEVPVVGAVVSATEGSPATAQIEVIPANAGLRLAARSKVILAYLDPDQDILLNTAVLPEHMRGRLDDAYKLLFSGEIFSLHYAKTGYGSRSLTLQCLDDSNILDTTYLYTLRYSSDTQEGIVAGNQTNFQALNSNGNPLDDILNRPDEVIRQIILEQRAIAKQHSTKAGLLGGVLGVLELIGGVPGKYIGITAWHTIQEARVRFMDQIATDSGATAAELFDLTAFDNWLQGNIGDAGTVISFRELIARIGSYIYYAMVPNPVGVYRSGSRDPPNWSGVSVTAQSSGAQALPSAATGSTVTSSSRAFQPEFQPFVDQILARMRARGWDGKTRPAIRISSGVRTAAEQARLMVGTSRSGSAPYSPHMYGYAADFSLSGGGIGFVYKNNPSESSSSLHRRLLFWASQGLYATDTALYASGKFTAAEVTTARQIVNFYRDLEIEVDSVGGGKLRWGGTFAAQDVWLKLHGLGGDPVHVELLGWANKAQQAGTLFKPQSTVGTAPLAEEYEGIPDRELLLTQIFRPDMWFVPPPACNVIFPEEVTSLTFSRDMMRETTRLHLSTFNSVIGDDVIVNQNYFAPRIDQALSLTSGGLGTAAKAFIYPHEKFSGVIPKMDHMSELAFYSRLSNAQGQPDPDQPDAVAIANTATPPTTEDINNELDKWAARTAAFSYLSYRYEARRLHAEMKFTPRIAVGLPALVIDRTVPEGYTAAERLTNPFTPNHFLGMVRSLTHSLSQGGGTTSVSLSHVRTHKADHDDIFSAAVYASSGVMDIQVQTVNDVTTTIPIGSGMDPRLFDWAVSLKQKLADGLDVNAPVGLLGPNGKALAVSGALTVTFTTAVLPSGGTYVPVTSGVDTALRADVFPFSNVVVVERGTTTYTQIEEAMRPPWMSDEFANDNIGALYDNWLGCGSMLELYSGVPARTLNGNKFTAPGIEELTEKIAEQYTIFSDGGYLAHEFIRNLTMRDYATLPQVIGANGFFEQSCGNYSGLSGSMFSWMLGNSSTSVPPPTTRVAPTVPNSIDPQLDPRQERWNYATAYRDELLQAQALRG